MVTGPDGRVRWPFVSPAGGRPVVGAVPVSPGGRYPLSVVLDQVDEHGVTVRVWSRGRPAADIEVHLVVHTATSETAG